MIKYILILELLILQASLAYAAEPANADLARIAAVLDSYHTAAAEGEWDTYFDLMSDDGVFHGTDASERWEKEEFRVYAGGRSGWKISQYHLTFPIPNDLSREITDAIKAFEATR